MAKRRRRSVKSWKNKSKKLFRTLKQWGMGGMVLALVVSAYLGLTETEPGRMLADQALHLLGGQGSQGTILAQGEAEGATGAIHFIVKLPERRPIMNKAIPPNASIREASIFVICGSSSVT